MEFEELVQQQERATVELSGELMRRVDALVERMQHQDLGLHLRFTRELVVRMALLHGLEELEKASAC
ncbi:MAG: hypothetical protein JST54_22810 [Deltaproteobacteria bacterium]|nr:hypothetical protein [Deltaproteobacteria bacterium]